MILSRTLLSRIVFTEAGPHISLFSFPFCCSWLDHQT